MEQIATKQERSVLTYVSSQLSGKVPVGEARGIR